MSLIIVPTGTEAQNGVKNPPDATKSPTLNYKKCEYRAKWYWKPTFESLIQAGSDVGGERDEFQDQNRGRIYLEPGVRLHYSQPEWDVGMKFSLHSEQDSHYYSASQQARRAYNDIGEAYAYVFLPDLVYSGENGCPVRAGERNDQWRGQGISFRAGRTYLEYDPEGFLFKGNAPVMELSRLGKVMGLNLKFYLRQQLVNRADKPLHLEQTTARFSSAGLKVKQGKHKLEAFYGFYRAPGRAAIGDIRLSQDFILLPGQGALPDRDVHYYSLGYTGEFGDWDLRTLFYYNHGREIAVGTDSVRQGLTRKSIRGYLGYGSLGYTFGGEGGARECSSGHLSRLGCITHGKYRGSRVAFNALVTSTDGTDDDDTLKGFGSLRPSVAVMGGPASIFLSGPGPGQETLPLRNSAPYDTFSDSGIDPATLQKRDVSTNDAHQLAPPAFANGGLSVYGFHYTFAPFRNIRLDAFLNYGNFLKGKGLEGILALEFQIKPLNMHLHLFVFAAATGAYYKPSGTVADPWTGFPVAESSKYYSRYLIGLHLRY